MVLRRGAAARIRDGHGGLAAEKEACNSQPFKVCQTLKGFCMKVRAVVAKRLLRQRSQAIVMQNPAGSARDTALPHPHAPSLRVPRMTGSLLIRT